MNTNYVEKLLALQAEEEAIKTKRNEFIAAAKTEALDAAERAVADLNNLGYHYRLVETETVQRPTRAPQQDTSRTRSPRKGGISKQVLAVIKAAPGGLPRAGVLAAMNAEDDKAQQSISNALANAKKKGLLIAKDGIYQAV